MRTARELSLAPAAGRLMAQDDWGRLLDRGIHRMLVIDARGEPDPEGASKIRRVAARLPVPL